MSKAPCGDSISIFAFRLLPTPHERILPPYCHGSSEDLGIFSFISHEGACSLNASHPVQRPSMVILPLSYFHLARKMFQIRNWITTFAYEPRLRIVDAREKHLASNHNGSLIKAKLPHNSLEIISTTLSFDSNFEGRREGATIASKKRTLVVYVF